MEAFLGRKSGSLVDLLRQYGAGVKQRLGLLADDPAEFARGALLDVVPNYQEAQAAQARLMGGQVDPQQYGRYVDKMRDISGLLASIKVYHGSPHKFDKFDLSKIGTGEGAQAYGHGAYFAESADVARGYAKRLGVHDTFDGKKVTKDLSRDDSIVSIWVSMNGGDPKAAVNAVQKLADDAETIGEKWYYSDLAKKIKERGSLVGKVDESHLYEANLRWPDAAREAADPMGPQHFLDWDKPLYRQPKPVRQAVRGLVDDTKGAGTYAEWVKAARPDFQNLRTDMLEGMDESQIAADLLKRGVPGVRYLDAGSRGKSGTSNYVVFDDALIELLTRNGAPVKK